MRKKTYLAQVLSDNPDKIVRVQEREFATNVGRIFSFKEYIKDIIDHPNDESLSYFMLLDDKKEYKLIDGVIFPVADDEKKTLFQNSVWEMTLEI